jgi:hypothetical protein
MTWSKLLEAYVPPATSSTPLTWKSKYPAMSLPHLSDQTGPETRISPFPLVPQEEDSGTSDEEEEDNLPVRAVVPFQGPTLPPPTTARFPFLKFEGDPLLAPQTLGHFPSAQLVGRLSFPVAPSLLEQNRREKRKGSIFTIRLLTQDTLVTLSLSLPLFVPCLSLTQMLRETWEAVTFPSDSHYRLNGAPLVLKKPVGRGEFNFGYDITSYCHVGMNQLVITAKKCCCVSAIPVSSRLVSSSPLHIHSYKVPQY